MQLNLQRKSISTVIQILARYKRTLIRLLLLLKIRIPSKTNRSVSSVPWITQEIRRKIRRRNKTHAKAKTTGSKKLRSKFQTLRKEIKDDVRKQYDLYVNNLVGDVKANPRDSYRYIKTIKVFHPLKEEEEVVLQLQKLNRLRN